ncbi:MAG: Nif3-like dinuclear metal center hexameric protein [bacterium]|nr:Nif3-like dinuclear metal center hexameric protein [bacterium]
MKAIEINQHLNAQFSELKPGTVDRVIYGDPDREVEGIAVAWMPYRWALERARELGANVLVTHEPTFYSHRDLEGDMADEPASKDKQAFIDDLDITVIRCHDVWDALPEIGIPFAWGNFLELGEPVGGERYYNVYEVDPQPARDFARHVAGRTTELGQPTVEFYGDPDREIRTVGLGTGCISSPFKLYELGADLAISVDDIVRAWVAGEWCQDEGRPLLVVNHCVTEEPGMVTLAQYLEAVYPDIPISHIPQQCTYQSITA